MASNRGQGERGNQGGTSRERGFASMNDEEQRRIAQKGGEASSRQQERDDQGQFKGSGSSRGQGGSNQGGSNQGGSNQGGSRQGGSNRS